MRPLARSLTETIVEGAFALLSASVALVVLVAFDPDAQALVSFLPGAALSVAALVLLERGLPRTGAYTPRPTPADAERESALATVRRLLFGRDALWLAFIPMAYLTTEFDLPGPQTLVAGAVVGAAAGASLYGLRDAARIARWEHAHGRIILHEAVPVPLSSKPLWRRAVYSEPRGRTETQAGQ